MCVCVLAFLGILRYITWNSVERRSVMASTADIQVNANRGRTTQELHREALPERQRGRRVQGGNKAGGSGHTALLSLLRSCLGAVRKADWHAAVAFTSYANRVVRDDV